MRNFASSAYGFLGCSDQDGDNRIQNWAKTFYYYPSHLPRHPEHTEWVLYYQ